MPPSPLPAPSIRQPWVLTADKVDLMEDQRKQLLLENLEDMRVEQLRPREDLEEVALILALAIVPASKEKVRKAEAEHRASPPLLRVDPIDLSKELEEAVPLIYRR